MLYAILMKDTYLKGVVFMPKNKRINLSMLAQTVKMQNEKILKDKAEGKVSAVDLEYFNYAKSTYIDFWNPALLEKSIPTKMIKMTLEEATLLTDIQDGKVKFGKDNIPDGLRRLWNEIDMLLKEFPNGAFIRLGSRSPKDSYTAEKLNYCWKDTFNVLESLLESTRIFEDLCRAERLKYEPTLIMREWMSFEKWQEFRCFIKDGELVGISQYYYHNEVFEEIKSNEKDIIKSIKDKVEETKPFLPTPSVVFDVIYNKENTIFLEINPFGKYTDPCLFTWQDDFSELQFKYHK